MSLNSDTIIIKKEPLLRGQSRDDFIKKLTGLLEGSVIEAYVFGSLATDTYDCDSDIDLLLVARSTRPFIERPLDYPQLYDLDVPFDVLVYTPEEFEKIRKDEPTPFWKNVLTEMIKII